MRTFTSTFLFSMLLFLMIVVAMPCIGQTSMAYNQGALDTYMPQRDSASKARMSNVDDVAKRVDSL